MKVENTEWQLNEMGTKKKTDIYYDYLGFAFWSFPEMMEILIALHCHGTVFLDILLARVEVKTEKFKTMRSFVKLRDVTKNM